MQSDGQVPCPEHLSFSPQRRPKVPSHALRFRIGERASEYCFMGPLA